MALGLVVCAALALVTLLVYVLVPTSAATDQRGRAQTAADAAALAGAGGVLDDVEARLGDPLPGVVSLDDPSSVFDGAFYALFTGSAAFGSADADRLAAANGAHVTSYRYDWLADRVQVQVQMDAPLEGGERSRAEASARLGVRFGQCQFTDLPTPVPTPTPTTPPSPDPTVSPTEPATPPGPVDLDLDCDGHDLRFSLDGGGRLRITPPGQLRSWNRLEPRLVS